MQYANNAGGAKGSNAGGHTIAGSTRAYVTTLS
jgi:hypothetical protein